MRRSREEEKKKKVTMEGRGSEIGDKEQDDYDDVEEAKEI